MAEPIIGIDLGTTNSVVAIMENGQPRVLGNKLGHNLTPSIVAVTDNDKRMVGYLAKRQAITNAKNTVYGAKRLIGRKWHSEEVQAAREVLAYQCKEGPHDDVRIVLRDKQYSVPEISAMVLQEMRAVAEERLGQPVQKAVVTVPAYFGDGQRQATKDAGRIAGLDIIRIINEPTAAALAYGFTKKLSKRIAVFDLGGGTFDISILDIQNSVFEVLATSGDTFLGGDDFDQRVVDWLAFAFAKEHKVDLRKEPMALQRLRDAAERAKCELSSREETEINLPFIYAAGKETFHLQRKLSREKLSELCADLIDRTIAVSAKTLVEAQMDKGAIDDVILVGGMTRMLAVQQAVERFFGKPPSKGVHPDEVVALGASIQASLLAGEAGETLLLDVTPHDLGIMVAGGAFKPLVEKNSTVPVQKSEIFTTIRDDQTQVRIMILQGESETASQNELLGEFVLEGLRQAKKGEVRVEVTFEISADGIVSVRAKDLETGREQQIVVTASSGLTEAEIEKMATENQDYLVSQRTSEEFERDRTSAERLVRDIEKLMPLVAQGVQNTQFGGDAIQKAEKALQRTRDAILTQDRDALARSIESLQKTLEMLRGISSALRP
jgi:molecular chaperone DnaK